MVLCVCVFFHQEEPLDIDLVHDLHNSEVLELRGAPLNLGRSCGKNQGTVFLT